MQRVIILVLSCVVAAQAQSFCSILGGTCTTASCASSIGSGSVVGCPSGSKCCRSTAPRVSCGAYGGKCMSISNHLSCAGRKISKINGYPACSSSSQFCCKVDATTATTRWTTGGTTPKVGPEGKLNAAGCGIRKASKVVGGKNAERGEWPWQIQLYKNGRYSCGGSLITSQWVISAGHCFRGSYSSVKVRVGEHRTSSREGTEEDIPVSKVFVHPSFSLTNTRDNSDDIALLKLSRPVKLGTKNAHAVCAPKADEQTDSDKDCYVTGWGLTQSSSRNRDYLQEVQGPLVPISTCRRYWPATNNQICFGNGRHGACRGDSGGPLVCNRGGKFYMVGVVSFGTPECTKYPYPTVFTRFSKYIKWVEYTMATQ